jgi:hypothetical protein
MDRSFRAIMVRRETLLLAIEVHGPEIVYDRAELYRSVAKYDQWGLRQVKHALLRGGMNGDEVVDLMNHGHPAGCACWRCIIWLHNEVRRTRAHDDKARDTR